MYKRFISFTVIIILVMALQSYTQDTELYFGAQGNQIKVYDNMDAAHLDTMKNILGFNVYSPLDAWPTILNLMDDSLKLIPNMQESRGWDGWLDEYHDYLYAHYAVVQAEDETHQIRFRTIDATQSNGFVYGPVDPQGDTAIFLDSLWYKYSTTDIGPFRYGIAVNIDLDNLDYSDTLGFMRVRTGVWYSNPAANVDTTFYIMSDPFLDSSQATCYLEFQHNDPPGLDWIQVATLQERTLGIDSFKVSNLIGRDLVDEGRYVSEIVGFATAHSDHAFFWYLRDEPHFTQWKPFEVVRDALENYGGGNSIFSISNRVRRPDSAVKYNLPVIVDLSPKENSR